MTTGRVLIQDSLQDIGVGNPGDSLDPQIMNRSLRILVRMLSSWSSELNPIYASTIDSLTWTSGSQSMTIGTGGDLDTVRPIEITGFQITTAGVDYTLIPVSFEQYEQTPIKDIESNYPITYAYQKSYPLGKIYLYYVPADNSTISIQSKKPLATVTLDDDLSFPDGYELAIQTNLTILLAASFGKEAKPSTVRAAINAKAAIEDINEVHAELYPDAMCPGTSQGLDDLGALTNG